MTAVPTTTLELPNGGAMPLLGFGTWQLRGGTARSCVETALEVGYRHLDTATLYQNETEVGAAVAASGLPRSDVFVTTKCRVEDAGRERAALETSLDKLGLDQVDLWLVHWPPAAERTVPMWEAFVAARSAGLARDIGVSNFPLELVDEVTDATGVRPAVNQVKWGPLLFDQDYLHGHRARGVVFEGYSGLKGGVLTKPVVVGIAEQLGRDPAQVVLRWHLQHHVVAIPRSSNAERIRANAQIGDFELSREDMSALDALGTRAD